MKVVGQRRRSDVARAGVACPAEAVKRAAVLQAQAERLNPFPRPRGFVYRARTWEDYARWRREQENPRLW